MVGFFNGGKKGTLFAAIAGVATGEKSFASHSFPVFIGNTYRRTEEIVPRLS